MEYTKHISVTERDGFSVITVDDCELFDYLDDFFVEQDIDPIFISKEVNQLGRELHLLHFTSQHTPLILINLLSKISIAEIERIYSLKN
jgi:hypothetical protein